MAVNPKSLANLEKGRLLKSSKPRYDEAKKRRHLTVTETGWKAIKEKAEKELGLSVSEMLERIARGEYELVKVK